MNNIIGKGIKYLNTQIVHPHLLFNHIYRRFVGILHIVWCQCDVSQSLLTCHVTDVLQTSGTGGILL